MTFKRQPLNKVTHSVRASQAVLQYGVGAMVDFPDQTLMTAAPELWASSVKRIHDERLEKALHVDFLGMPDGEIISKNDNSGISYVRFPEWYFCPKCRRFQPISSWIDDFKQKASTKAQEYDPYMVKRMVCPTCRQGLVVARIITVCEHGHIDDFPWVKWVHCKNTYGGNKPICANPRLTFKTGATATEGLEGLTIACDTCGAKTTLKGAFDPEIFQNLDKKYNNQYDFTCSGRHPWKNESEICLEYPKVLQRGSSSVYFPVTSSSLVIPPYSSILTTKIENSQAFESGRNAIMAFLKMPGITQEMKNQFLDTQIEDIAEKIALEIGESSEQIKSVLIRKWKSESEEEYSTVSVKYRSEEYEALSGEVALESAVGDFQREATNIEDYNLPFVKQISLIHKIREVQALTGFSRINPADKSEPVSKQGHVVSVKKSDTNWYPAYEVKGEGIFIEFDSDAINEWRTQNSELQRRVELLNDNYKKSFIGSHNPRTVTGKFLLLHTISHLLIKQLSFECGYSIASLRERLYCSEPSEGKDMAGIFIYTASGDSEGTLGGLVRQGRPDTFPYIFKKAIESGMVCSNDPVCSLSLGQGRDSLNLSACYSCGLLPETSCEEFNIFLDRGTVVGTFKNKELGLFYKYLYCNEKWSQNSKLNEEKESTTENVFIIPKENSGINYFDENYTNIWSNLKQWSEEENEKRLLDALVSESSKFNGKEKPIGECAFITSKNNSTHKASLLWKKSKVLYFSSELQEDYEIAKNSDWKCFFGNDENLSADQILKSIKEA